MQASSTEPGSRYLSLRLRTLHDVCRDGGRDDDGKACPTCAVRDICVADQIRAEAAPVAVATDAAAEEISL